VMVIILNCISMSLEPHPGDANESQKYFWDVIELTFIIVYTLECALKIFANGLVF
jgi:hypothetical protein